MLQSLQDRFYLNFIKDDRWMYIVDGLKVTLLVTFFAVLIGIVIGFLVATVRSTYDKTGKLKILNILCQIYLTVIRGTPVVVQLLIKYRLPSWRLVLTPAHMWRKSSVPVLCPLTEVSLKPDEASDSIMCRPCAISLCRRHLKTCFRRLVMSLSCC